MPPALAGESDLRSRARPSDPATPRAATRPGPSGSGFREPLAMAPALPAIAAGSSPGPAVASPERTRPSSTPDPRDPPHAGGPPKPRPRRPWHPRRQELPPRRRPPGLDLPGPDLRRLPKPPRERPAVAAVAPPTRRATDGPDPLAMAPVTPSDPSTSSFPATTPSPTGLGRRAWSEVPAGLPVAARPQPERPGPARRGEPWRASRRSSGRWTGSPGIRDATDGRWDGGTARKPRRQHRRPRRRLVH